LFADIGEEMTEEELALSRSTPSCRFDVPARAPAAGPAAEAPQPLDPEAERFVADIVGDEPVVLFALEWCEFCWSVRKLFARLGIEFTSVDLDSVAYQAGDRGGKIRAVLAARTGTKAIPQIFIGGTHVGGATDHVDAWRNGTARQRRTRAGLAFDTDVARRPHSRLPARVRRRRTAGARSSEGTA